MIVHTMPQRSPEWFAARAGKLTGSAAADVLATIKSGEAAARRDLRLRLVTERLTGLPQEDTFTNAAMQWGTDHEAEALSAYQAVTGEMAMAAGFCAHEVLPIGCSPDAYVGDWEGLVSIKCPKSSTHLGYLKSGVFPAAYLPQMWHELWVTGAQWYDFLSFDPRFPERMQRFHLRMERDEGAIAAYAAKATEFLAEVAAEVSALEAR